MSAQAICGNKAGAFGGGNMIKQFILAMGVVAAGIAPAQAANFLINGDFEQGAGETIEVVPNDTRGVPTGWSRVPTRDYVDILHDDYAQNSPGYYVLLDPQSGDYFLDMNGGGSTGGIYQDVTGLSAGRNYTLSLYTGRWAQNAFGILGYSLIDPTNNLVLASGSFDSTGTDGWFERTLTAAASSAGSLRVQIETLYAYQGAPGLDNVSLVAAAGVPEPASWAMMLGGFGAIGAAMRRRRRIDVTFAQ